MATPKICPECDHEFPHGWDGIDSHWRSKHNHIMRYEEAWPLLDSGQYKPKHKRLPHGEDPNQAAFRVMREATKD